MTARTAEAWGRVAVGLPGFRWPCLRGGSGYWTDPRGYVYRPRIDGGAATWMSFPSASIDPDDPATAGCLLALLGGVSQVWHTEAGCRVMWWPRTGELVSDAVVGWPDQGSLGRACIAVAEKRGRWGAP